MRIAGVIVSCVLATHLVSAGAQPPAISGTDTRSRLLQIPGLQQSPGVVPVYYAPEARDRAIAYEKSLISAHEWFEQQLNVHVPMELFVLNREAWGKVSSWVPWPLLYSTWDSNPNAVIVPDRVEELVGHEPGATLPGEYITFHEAGHIFANQLKIQSGNPWVNELVANIFMAAYIQARRPDLMWALQGPEAHGMKELPRFTSLRDLDYVYAAGVGSQNYAWFQHEIERLAAFLVAEQSFATVIKQLQVEFPAGSQRQESLDQIVAHLDRIRPGSRQILGPVDGPSKLPHIIPVACPSTAATKDAPSTVIAIQNDSGHPLTISDADGRTKTLQSAKWDRFLIKVGESLKLSGGTCLVGTEGPSLAVINTK